MSRIIDTKIKTDKERPQLKIGDKIYEVDNRKKTFDKIEKLRKDKTISETDMTDKIIEMTLGKKQANEILELDITLDEYVYLTFCIMAAITGEDPDELQKAAKEKN